MAGRGSRILPDTWHSMAGATGEGAFTGLEAALVLIAFIVVASVFSYTLLNTGFLITQKSQTVVYNAVGQTTSTLDLSGRVLGIGEPGDTTAIFKLNFSCGIPLGGSPVDFETLVLTYSNKTQLETLERDPATYNPAGCTRGSGMWALYQRTMENGESDNLLEGGEQFVISACPSQPMVAGDSFTLEVKPAVGVALSISRNIPSVPKEINGLH